MRKLLGPVILALVGVLAAVPNALAADRICDGTHVLTGTYENVVVPAGVTCTMVNAKVKGNVKVFGALDVFPPTTIGGSIHGEPGHAWVRLFNGAGVVEVGGNVQIKGGTAGPSGAGGFLAGTKIGGSFQWEENSGFLIADSGSIGGALKMEKSTGGGMIHGNTINGVLECKENSPVPFGTGNKAQGKMKDQCSGF